ncbi:unnamed protein product [Echinostoma caproni]|uniref:Secreted protein n=1 Tax=Echinostoma caproni TaxID=27848 RepID=A0A183AAF6_9TREM|nr:unnamed protein product [Echinostoma caproni]
MAYSLHSSLYSMVFCVMLVSQLATSYYVWPVFYEKRFISTGGSPDSPPSLFRPVVYMNPQPKSNPQDDEPTGVPNLMRYG